jgi:HSP20 family protein
MTARGNHPLERLRRDFETLLGPMWTPWEGDTGEMRLWDFNITESEKEITLRAELPGFEPNELDVQLQNDVLTIKAQKEQRSERSEEYRSFYRSITLPPGVDAEKAQATYRNGVLEMHIPRSAEAAPRRIQIQPEQGGASQPKEISGQAAPEKAQGQQKPPKGG